VITIRTGPEFVPVDLDRHARLQNWREIAPIPPDVAARHEAGHAVAAWALSFFVGRVILDVRPDGRATGAAKAGSWMHERPALTQWERGFIAREMVVEAAGPIAEHGDGGMVVRWAHDAIIKRLAWHLRPGMTADRVNTAASAAWQRAASLMVHVWPAVRAVADELLRRRSLTGVQVCTIAHRATGIVTEAIPVPLPSRIR
jgi:hypothetical protein